MNTVIVGLTSSVIALVIGRAGGLRPRPLHLPAAGRAHRPVHRRAWPSRSSASRSARRGRSPSPRRSRSSLILAQTIGRRFTPGARQQRHRVLADLAADPAADRGRRSRSTSLFQQVGLLDNIAALIITYVATNLPIVVWLMRDYFAALPRRARGVGGGRRRVGLPDRPLDRPADLRAGPRRDVPDRPDLRLERVPHRAGPRPARTPRPCRSWSPPRTRPAGRSGGRCRS